jgi:hypothetical protein
MQKRSRSRRLPRVSKNFLSAPFSCEVRPANFLNCTKNTELTPRHFPRTVTFALTRKNHSKPGSDNNRAGNEPTASQWPQRLNGRRFMNGVCAPMKASEWKTYRTRFLVKAKRLNSNLTFTDPLGREHCGRKGDYLVEFSDGVQRIAPRHFFEDVYVPMAMVDEQAIISLDQAAGVRHKQPQSCRVTSPRMGLM